MIDLSDIKNWPTQRTLSELQAALNDGTAKKLTVDPYSWFSNPPEDFVAKHSEMRDKAWVVIKRLVEDEPAIYDPFRRGPLVRSVCKELRKHKKVVHDYLKRYWIRGKMINALLPQYNKSGAPGRDRISVISTKKRGRRPKLSSVKPNLVGINVTETDLKNIRSAIKQFYLTPQKPPWTEVYEEMKRNYYNKSVTFKDGKPVPIMVEDNEIITFFQFRYWAEKELASISKALERRVGKRKYALTKRPLLGNATQRAFGPGSVFEIDATVANLYLVSSLDPNRIIGRSVVYTIKDVFSRLIVGLYVGVEGPSWLGAMMALENATCDKVSFCAEYGITIEEEDWPCHYLPKTITADRGEMEGKNADPIALSLGIRIDNMPPYRADLKGIIEQQFDIYDEKIGSFAPGKVDMELRERGEPDYRLGARMTRRDFTKVLIYSVLEHNNQELSDYPFSLDMTHEKVPPLPLELWNWGIINCSGQLQERPREIIRLNLMPHVEATVTRQGIEVNHKEYGILRYSCQEVLSEGWYEQAVQKGRFKVQVAFDPRNVSAIYIPINNGTDYWTCELLDRFERFRDLSVEEVMDQFFYEGLESKQRRTSQNQNRATYGSMRKHVMVEAIAHTEAALDPSHSAASRTKDIRAARRDEREKIREEEAWNLGEVSSNHTYFKSQSNTVAIDNYQEQEDTDPLLDMIIQEAKERRQNHND